MTPSSASSLRSGNAERGAGAAEIDQRAATRIAGPVSLVVRHIGDVDDALAARSALAARFPGLDRAGSRRYSAKAGGTPRIAQRVKRSPS